MKFLPLTCLLVALCSSAYSIHAASLYDIPLKDIDGKDASLKAYSGKVLLIVNVASKCGYTRQYKTLEAVHRKYADKGFTVLGFPSNDFGGQEPGNNAEIKQFCTSKFDVTFPMFDKVTGHVTTSAVCTTHRQRVAPPGRDKVELRQVSCQS